MEVHGDPIVFDHHTLTDSQDVSDLSGREASLHQLLHPGVVADLPTDRLQLVLSLSGDVGLVLPSLMESTDQSFVCRVASLVVDVAAHPAEHATLAALEVLVHLGSPRLLSAYSILRCEFDSALLRTLVRADLPADWRSAPPPASLRQIGDRWLTEQASPVLGVPSAVIPLEHNYLINPLHPEFPRLALGLPEPFGFDPRLA